MNTKKWTTLLVMSLSSLMATINSSSLNATLPYIAKILHLNLKESQMILVVYLIILTSILTICGKIADLVGHKKTFLSGTLIFGLSSLLVLLGDKVTLILIMRIIQAIGASLMVSSGPAILFSIFEPEKRGFAIGIHTTGISLGLIIGPPVGGFILKYLGWKWIFLINVPFSIISFIAILLIIDQREQNKIREKGYDINGMLLWAISIPLILISLSILSHSSEMIYIPILMLTTGIVIFIFLVKYELNVESPFFPINLMRIPAYYGGLLSLLLGYTALFISNFQLPFYLKIVLGLDPGHTGIIMSFNPIAMFATTGIAGYVSDRIGYYKLCITGMLLLSLGILLMSLVERDTAIYHIALSQIIIGSGLGIFNSPNTTALLNISGKNETGITTGLLATMRNLGMSLGTVLAGVLISTIATVISGSKIGKITEIPPDLYGSVFRYSMLISFFICIISVYLSSIRKGTPRTSREQR